MNENVNTKAQEVVDEGKEVDASALLEGITAKPTAKEKRILERGLKEAQLAVRKDLEVLFKNNKPQILAHVRLYGGQELKGLILSKYFGDIKKILEGVEATRNGSVPTQTPGKKD